MNREAHKVAVNNPEVWILVFCFRFFPATNLIN